MIILLVKTLKNPRSAVCKTGIMTSADILHAYNDQLINFLDPLVTEPSAINSCGCTCLLLSFVVLNLMCIYLILSSMSAACTASS